MSSTTMTPSFAHPRAAPLLRLTRRGRVVVFAAWLLAALLTVLLLTGGASVATEEAGVPASTQVVMVHDGDTLWAIAAAVTSESGDVRETMTRIERLNALESGLVYAGQRLRIPVG